MNPFQKIYDAQKAYFGIGVTRGYEWRVEQLDRMATLLSENEAALQKVVAADFKSASREFVFETAAPLGETQFQKSQLKAWMEPVEARLPKFLAETDPIMEDEVFGPILPILTYRTLDEALARTAATPHPLAAFVFSRDQETIDRFVGELSYGGGAVNQVNIHLFIESIPSVEPAPQALAIITANTGSTC